MNLQFKTPVLFLIFNRPDTTKQVFEAIRKYQPKQLFIAADGPRKEKTGEKELCEQTRKIVSNIDWDCEVKTLFREKNLGCGKAVSEAITWFFENVEEGIILEDDCLPNEIFFVFSEYMLKKYRNNTNVFNISGYSPINFTKYKYSYYPSLFPGIWGWATWKRTWNLYDYKIKNWDKYKKTNWIKIKIKNKKHSEWLSKSFDLVYNNEIDTWDYQFTFALLDNEAISLHPNISLVENIGFMHKNATHTKSSFPTNNHNKGRFEFPITEPCDNSMKPLFDKKIFNFYFGRRNNLIKIFKKIYESIMYKM